MSENGNLLVAEGVRKEFGGLVAVNDVDFTVPRGRVVSLIGPNGAGKTTFFNMLTGVYKPTAGRIVFLDEDVTGKPPHAITNRGIGRTFQNIRLFQNMTALENVLVGMHGRLKANIVESVLRTPRVRREETRAREEAFELLAYTNLRRKAYELAKNLPYGEQRRLEVARALATDPQLLLLDETAGGLTEHEVHELVDVIRAIKARGVTIIWIEHIVHALTAVVDRIVLMNFGAKLLEGEPAEVLASPELQAIYLGVE